MDALNKLVMRLNFFIQRHPSRWLYTERLLGRYMGEHETRFFMRDWGEGVVWDVGASIGKYTTIIARQSPWATIFAFEPNLNSLYYPSCRTAKFTNGALSPTP
ncbi:MAG: hypothetical protein WBN22_01790 [Verrucomicrobiia bacterium]